MFTSPHEGSPHPAAAAARPGRLRRVLAASFLDGSGARAVLRAARLPLAPGARLAVVHVTPPWSSRARPVPGAAARDALERALAAAREASRAAGNEGTQLVPILAEGWPAAEIVRVAWQERSELVVVGPPGLRPDGTARGTVARVTRRADLPLLVARDEPWRDYRRVLCAVDRSVTAIDTVALAARLAAPGAELTLFHAYHVPFERWMRGDGPERARDAMAYLEALAREVADEVAVTRIALRRGEACLQTVATALHERADLVVLGTHGRSGLSRALRGSATEWMVANAPFDLAVARPHRATLERR